MLETITEFLTLNSAIIGALTASIEFIIVLINSWKKFAAVTKGEVDIMSASPSGFKAFFPTSFKGFVWVINPVNCFRKHK